MTGFQRFLVGVRITDHTLDMFLRISYSNSDCRNVSGAQRKVWTIYCILFQLFTKQLYNFCMSAFCDWLK